MGAKRTAARGDFQLHLWAVQALQRLSRSAGRLIVAIRVVVGGNAAFAQFHHQRGEIGDMGLDTGAGVIIQIVALEQAS
jgi:hypothetical protein